MNKITRIVLLIIAALLYWRIIFRASSVGSSVGLILLAAILLAGMESMKRKRDKIFILQSDVKELSDMNRESFAEYMAELFKRLQYYVEPIRSDKGKGSDFILRKGKQVICVRCEVESPDSLISLQELGDSVSYYRTNKSMLIANGHFNEEARSFAKQNNIQLIDRDHLVNMMNQVINQTKISNKQLKAQKV